MSPENNEKAWKCAGCGAPSPDRLRACDCPTERLYQDGVRNGVLKVEPTDLVTDQLVRAVLGMRPKRTYSHHEMARLIAAARTEEQARAAEVVKEAERAYNGILALGGNLALSPENLQRVHAARERAAACLTDNQGEA